MAREKTAPAWRRVFLRALARGGSVALAAEECGIDRTSAYQLRKRNAAFAKNWDRALETAREALSPCGGRDLPRPSANLPEAPACAGEREILGRSRPKLRGDEVVRSSKAGRVCIARAGPGRWSARAERAFFAELNATGNVTAAARVAGVSTQAVYSRRKLWPAFAAQWREAAAEGYARIEMLLIHAATNTLNPEPSPEAAREAPPMSMELAFNLHKLHRASQQGGKPQRYGWRSREPDIEDVRAEILRKVAVMERGRG